MHAIETDMVDPTATSPGAILKRCREYHGLTLEEAEEATKIGANYLAALEDDQISQFASLAYLKGFLRIYAAYLGLNPDDMIRLYDRLYAPGGGREDLKKLANSEKTPYRKRFPLQKLVVPAALLLLILITSAIINRSPAPPAPPARPEMPVTPPTVLPAATAVQQAVSSAGNGRPAVKTEKPASGMVQSEPALPPAVPQKSGSDNSRGIIVRLKVTQAGSLTVHIDGSGSQAYDLTVGDNIEWKADRTVTLELSNAGGVEAELNGRPLKSFGPTGKAAVVILDAEGVRPTP